MHYHQTPEGLGFGKGGGFNLHIRVPCWVFELKHAPPSSVSRRPLLSPSPCSISGLHLPLKLTPFLFSPFLVASSNPRGNSRLIFTEAISQGHSSLTLTRCVTEVQLHRRIPQRAFLKVSHTPLTLAEKMGHISKVIMHVI